MRPQTLAHLSDLHLGRGQAAAYAEALCASLVDADIDHVVVTGDITDRGRARDYEHFQRIFEPFIRSGRLTVVPGNHDRVGEDCAREMMGNRRVLIDARPGLLLIRFDSTAPHNRSLITGHGQIGDDDIAAIDAALAEAPRDALTCVLLHHHLMPLPEEDIFERMARWLGRPWAAEVAHGHALIDQLRGRCDLVLHGHRHVPSEAHIDEGPRPLSVFNAGATLGLGRARIFVHRDGRLRTAPHWLDTSPGIAPTWGSGADLEPAW